MSQIGDLKMKAKASENIGYKAIKYLEKLSGSVVLRKDLNGLGSYRQISRELKKLIADKKLVKISNGVYAKAYTSKYTNIPLVKNGVDSTLREALKRLNIAFEPSSAEKDYNSGKTTQVPVRNTVRLKSRCRRRMGYGNSKLFFEKNINAK